MKKPVIHVTHRADANYTRCGKHTYSAMFCVQHADTLLWYLARGYRVCKHCQRAAEAGS